MKPANINPYQSGMAPDSAFRRVMGDDTALASRDVPGDGVRPESKGELYPCVIAKRERYSDMGADNARVPLAARLRSESWVLMHEGKELEYATYDDAETVARAILASPAVALAWHEGTL